MNIIDYDQFFKNDLDLESYVIYTINTYYNKILRRMWIGSIAYKILYYTKILLYYGEMPNF